ncbi:MAG: hypothetical protein R6W67_00355 [Bacteroidales bacterium]
MKRILLSVMVAILISAGAIARTTVAKGKTFSQVGDYKIEVAETPFILDGRELKTYVISYSNSPLKVTVAVDKDKKGSNYLVISDKLSVQYVCNSSYFGVEKLSRKYSKVGLSTSDNELNRSEYFHQKVLTAGDNSVLENTKLIASYFPVLVKDVNSILAAK